MGEERIVLRRVVVALDSQAEGETSIAEAGALADIAGAELVGMFIEEAAVERAMGLAAVRMVTPAGGPLRDVDPPSWRRSIRALVSLRRRELSRRAEGLKLRWSFQVEQGRLPQVVCRTVADMEVVVVGQVRRRRPLYDGSVVALLTDEASAARVVELATTLAARSDTPLHVSHQQERDPRGVAQSLRRLNARVVVASGRVMDEAYLETLRAGLACPLVLVKA